MEHSYLVRMTLRITCLVILALLPYVSIAGQDEEAIKVDTNLVTVSAMVTNPSGVAISGLTRDDFQVIEEGVEQKIDFFEPTESPFTVLLLLDVSRSKAQQLVPIVAAANAFARRLRPDDVFIAMSFADQVNTLLDATKRSELRNSINIRTRPVGGPTIIFDAVDEAIRKLKRVQGRKAIVLFSDGRGTGSASAKDNIRNAEHEEILIYTVQSAGPGIRPGHPYESAYLKAKADATDYMGRLAQSTGGRRIAVTDEADLQAAFDSVAGELRQQYSIGYYPSVQGKQGERRKIEVRLRRPGLRVRARDSYVARTMTNK